MGQFCSICGSQEERRQATAFADSSLSSSDIPDFHYAQPSLSQQQQQQAAAAVSGASSSSHPSDYNNSGHGTNNIARSDPGGKGVEENDENEKQQLAQYRLEQDELARREAIVTTASQTMVPVGNNFGSAASGHHRMMGYQQQQQQQHLLLQHNHSMGGIIMNSYYDPAYAAEAAQAILRSAAHTGGLVFSNDKATHAAMNVSIVGTLPKPSQSTLTTTTANSKDVIDMLGKGIWDGVRLGTRGRLAGCGGEDPEYYLDDLAEEILETMVLTKTALFRGCPPVVENLP